MATISSTGIVIEDFPFAGRGWQWTPVTEADSCAGRSCPQLADKSIQVEGTFDSASVALLGSNDGTNYHALSDAEGNVIAITAAGIVQVLETTGYIKPDATGGGSSQSLTITVVGRTSKV